MDADHAASTEGDADCAIAARALGAEHRLAEMGGRAEALDDLGVRTFVLFRHVDETGISGTGIVAEGAVFRDGTVALRWLSEHSSTGIYDNLAAVQAIHGHGGQTEIVFRE